MDFLTTLNEIPMALIKILAIIISTTIITRLVAFLITKMQRFKNDMTAIYLIVDIINYIIYFLALIAILQLFGIDLLGTLLSIGIIGIALSFAAKDIISNLFSGIILIIGKSIKVGDTIEIDGKKGIVQRIISLTDGSAVKLTVSKYYTPNGNDIHEKGIEPDVVVEFDSDAYYNEGIDNQLEEAKNYLTEKIAK